MHARQAGLLGPPPSSRPARALANVWQLLLEDGQGIEALSRHTLAALDLGQAWRATRAARRYRLATRRRA